jgi:hypothetical protein
LDDLQRVAIQKRPGFLFCPNQVCDCREGKA